MQEGLDQIYIRYLETTLQNELFAKYLIEGQISCPLFLDVKTKNGNYLNYKNRILFVGQETYGWVSTNEQKEECGLPIPYSHSDYINGLKQVYREFNLGYHYYNSPIYQFIGSVMSGLTETGYLLTNCLRHDGLGLAKNRVPNEIEDIITFNDNFVLKEEINTLAPTVVIFVSGPRYDDVIRKTFPEVRFQMNQTYSISEFSILESTGLKCKACRVYHPNYLQYKGFAYKQRIIADLLDFINKST